jgi:hypothetical protein
VNVLDYEAGFISETSDRLTDVQHCHITKALYFATEQHVIFTPYKEKNCDCGEGDGDDNNDSTVKPS